MGKQTKILDIIIKHFQTFEAMLIGKHNKIECEAIRNAFKQSANKNDIIRRILNQVVLSNDEKVSLLRIIYKKKESKK